MKNAIADRDNCRNSQGACTYLFLLTCASGKSHMLQRRDESELLIKIRGNGVILDTGPESLQIPDIS